MFATVWMNPKGFMLSEISTSEKDKIEQDSTPRIIRFIETTNRMVIARG